MISTFQQTVNVASEGTKTGTSWNGFASAVDRLSERGFNWADLLAAIVNGVSFVYHGANTLQGLSELIAKIWNALFVPVPQQQPATAVNYADIFQQQMNRQRQLIKVPRYTGN